MGGSFCDRSTQQSRSVGTETTDRRHGRVTRRGQFHRHLEARIAHHLLRLCEADLPALLRRVHPHGLELYHTRLGFKRSVSVAVNPALYIKADSMYDYM